MKRVIGWIGMVVRETCIEIGAKLNALNKKLVAVVDWLDSFECVDKAVCRHRGIIWRDDMDTTDRMKRARALLADALLPRDHGVYWCARDIDQRKINDALELLDVPNSATCETEKGVAG